MKRAFATLILLTGLRVSAATPHDQDVGFALSPALEKRILSPKNIDGIMQIRSVESFVRNAREFSGTAGGYVIIAIDLSLSGDFRFEGAWHGRKCFVRNYDDPSWDHAAEIDLPSSFEFQQFRSMSDDELEVFIAKHRAPNKAPDRTSPSVTPPAAQEPRH